MRRVSQRRSTAVVAYANVIRSLIRAAPTDAMWIGGLWDWVTLQKKTYSLRNCLPLAANQRWRRLPASFKCHSGHAVHHSPWQWHDVTCLVDLGEKCQKRS